MSDNIMPTQRDLLDAEIKKITGFTFDELPRWLRRLGKDRRGVPTKGHAESDILKDNRN